MLEFLILNFTNEGDIILDPMAGSGSTGVVAALHNRNAIQIDIEPKFYCFDGQTEILTRDGWKRYNEVTFNDEIATLNEEGYVEYQKPTNIFIYNYKGKMYHLETPYISLMVTPNHKLLVNRSSRSNKSVKQRRWQLIEAKEVYGHFARFKKDGKWRGEYADYFILPAVERGSSWGNAEPKKIPMNEWLKFFGLWLAEGSVTWRKDTRGYDNYIVGFCNKDESIIHEYVELAKKFGFNPFVSKNKDVFYVQIFDKQLYSYLLQFGKSDERFIPKEIKNLSIEQLKILFEYMMKGDGHRGKGGNWYLTTSKKLADDLQEILLKIGLAGDVYIKDMSKYGKAKKLQYKISIIQRCLTPSINHHANKWRNEEWVDYDGIIWCVEVPNHIVYIRRNGKAVWTGNSWMEKARENVEKAPTLAPKGWIKNILGDARRLSELLSRADIVITSPPYEEGLSHKRHHTPNTGRTEKLWAEKHLGSYPDSSSNIGSLKSSDDEYQALSEGRIQELVKKLMKNGKPTYLSEMLKVYREMWKVLKPSGRAIIIVKPFIRNKKVVDLPYHTYLLMKACGFELEKLYKLRLRQQSFWRTLMYKKHPELPRIAHEYVLICRKQS